jgi:hypothetical protein
MAEISFKSEAVQRKSDIQKATKRQKKAKFRSIYNGLHTPRGAMRVVHMRHAICA